MYVTDYKILFVHVCGSKVWKFILASYSFPSTQLMLTPLPHHSGPSLSMAWWESLSLSPYLILFLEKQMERNKFKELSHWCFLGISWISFQGSSLLYFLLNDACTQCESTEKEKVKRGIKSKVEHQP